MAASHWILTPSCLTDDKSEGVIASMVDAWQSILSGMVNLTSLQSLYLQATS
ncbi:hypothetical protein [Cysteiniphilum sp. 19S12-1]|uniref:hypothetical protein n=1 Tax=Cysteiniphilum sp. 19S12-1 TaxID=3453130 RepID=UPI003F82E514